tara:strand:+ start:137 stop:874 length:738 start_codon:yes stop_codon:yes gene_type:complete
MITNNNNNNESTPCFGCGVSADTIYQRVLALANKEQRGYITPQEFNLFANQAQREILDQYFYDINQWGRQSGNDTEYSDMLSVITEKLSCLNVLLPNQTVDNGVICISNDIYKLGSVFVNDTQVEVEEVNHNEYQRMNLTPLTKPSLSRPIYVNRIDGLNIYPNSIGSVDISYIKQPAKVDWGYVMVNDKALYNDNITVDFELHSSEESELVYRILAYAGIAIKQPDLVSSAVSLESTKVQQEKA